MNTLNVPSFARLDNISYQNKRINVLGVSNGVITRIVLPYVGTVRILHSSYEANAADRNCVDVVLRIMLNLIIEKGLDLSMYEYYCHD